MPSQLTRVVFRRLIANKPIVHRGCLQQTARPHTRLGNGLKIYSASQQRTFLNIFKPQRKVKDAELAPGIAKMSDLSETLYLKSRPPPPNEIARAFHDYFHHACDTPSEAWQMIHAARSYKYILENPRPDGRPWLSDGDIMKAKQNLAKGIPSDPRAHLQLLEMLYPELERGLQRVPESEDPKAAEGLSKAFFHDLRLLIVALCNLGETVQAREILERLSKERKEAPATTDKWTLWKWTNLWKSVFLGFCREDKGGELVKSVDILRKLGDRFPRTLHSVVVDYFCSKGDLEQAKYWYGQPYDALEDRDERVIPRSASILKLCAQKNDLDFGQRVIGTLLEDNPTKDGWDAIFLWSAAIGKGVDEVDRMMQVMVRRNAENGEKERPDIDTINNLVEYAMSKQDPYFAERCIALGEKWGIAPNAKTFIMQMEYRLAIKDIDGARASYFSLQGETIKGDEGVDAVNKLIRVMCESQRYDFNTIMGVVDELGERKGKFDPETVAQLCMLHLGREEFHDVVDLLQAHSWSYTTAQRAIIRDRFVDFCLDRKNSVADIWDTYQILRSIFNETPRDIRTRVMNEFFARGRSDMACHVFFHMRNHDVAESAATLDTYVDAFTGIARNADEESLELIHNQMKLDMKIELNTRLRNALMLAYALTDQSIKALGFWSEIVASREGPSYSSIAIAFRACEGLPFGDQQATSIWERLRSMDIDIDREIFSAFVGALCGNGQYDKAQKMVEGSEEEFGLTPDVLMIGTLINATNNSARQEKMEGWVKEAYPTVWAELNDLGSSISHDGFGFKRYNINRDIDP